MNLPENVEVIGTLGLAEGLLTRTGSLKPYNSWMGISTSRKTYPDSMVLDFAGWASSHSGRFMVVIADGMQVYNQMALKGVDALGDDPKQLRWFINEEKNNQRAASKRQKELRSLFREEGLSNTRVQLWSQLLHVLRDRDWKDQFVVDGFKGMAYAPGLDVKFDEQIKSIVTKQAGHVIGRSPIEKREESNFMAGFYPREQFALTMSLASLGIYKYLVKIGPEAERIYDEVALDVFREGFGTIRGIMQNEIEDLPFGAVYLRETQE